MRGVGKHADCKTGRCALPLLLDRGGTTAYVAEQWGRRWITIDTSRVAVALARQRLLTAKYDYYQQQHPGEPLHPEHNNFVYKSVPHITLKSIAQNQALDPIFARWEPVLAEKLATSTRPWQRSRRRCVPRCKPSSPPRSAPRARKPSPTPTGDAGSSPRTNGRSGKSPLTATLTGPNRCASRWMPIAPPGGPRWTKSTRLS